MHATLPLMEISDFPALRRNRLDKLQVNLGYKCNQSCLHCHVNAGPTRTEMMSRETIFEVIAYLKSAGITTLDLTGGAAPGRHRRRRARWPPPVLQAARRSTASPG